MFKQSRLQSFRCSTCSSSRSSSHSDVAHNQAVAVSVTRPHANKSSMTHACGAAAGRCTSSCPWPHTAVPCTNLDLTQHAPTNTNRQHTLAPTQHVMCPYNNTTPSLFTCASSACLQSPGSSARGRIDCCPSSMRWELHTPITATLAL